MSNPNIPDDDIGRFSTAVAGQVQVITDRLIEVLSNEDYDAITDEEVEDVPVPDPSTGELVVGLAVVHPRLGDVIFSILDGKLIVQRERKGRQEYARMGDDGEPVEPWTEIASPKSRSQFN